MTRKARDKIAAGLREAIAVARAEIERLTAENAKMRERLAMEWDGVATERDALRAENNNLRIENARLRKMLVQAPEYLERQVLPQASVERSCDEAAEEIERLTAENAKLRDEAREAFKARLGPRYTHLHCGD